MGQIQNQLNQLFMAGLGAAVSFQKSPYMVEKKELAAMEKEQAARTERLSQLEGKIANPEAQPRVDIALPLGADELKYKTLTPARERLLDRKIKEFEEKGDPEIEKRIDRETAEAARPYSDYFKEMRDITEKYNIAAARLGTERLDMEDITRKEMDLSQQIREKLLTAYTSKEGILKTGPMRREFNAMMRSQKQATGGKK